jgi:hypothetical protein
VCALSVPYSSTAYQDHPVSCVQLSHVAEGQSCIGGILDKMLP